MKIIADGEVSNRGESTLRSIEERLEQISEAISKIEDDSNNNRSMENGIDQIDVIDKDHSFRRPLRRTKKHRSVDTSRYIMPRITRVLRFELASHIQRKFFQQRIQTLYGENMENRRESDN